MFVNDSGLLLPCLLKFHPIFETCVLYMKYILRI